MAAFTALLGDSVVDNSGKTINPTELAKGKAVGLYFSAHWCGPCRAFTPELSRAYTQHLKNKGLEIVFVSSDRDAAAFKEYFGEMPWLALPYEARDLKQKLSSKFKVQGIPTLVILDSNGKLITKDGREAVSEDPEGKNFPWSPKSFQEIIGTQFTDKTGAAKTWANDLAGKVLGLYFSAHWCPPCRGFTPELVKTYNTMKADGKPFEIVFLSSDENEAAFNEYMKEMPWLAVPFSDRERKQQLSSLYGVRGIPTLVIVDANGHTITTQGRGAVSADPTGKEFPWTPKLVNELNGGTAAGVNDSAALIAFVADENTDAITNTMTAVATKHVAESKSKEEDQDLLFFVAKNHEIVNRVKKLMHYQTDSPVIAILDIPQEAAFYSEIRNLGDATQSAIEKFIADYKSGKATKVSFA